MPAPVFAAQKSGSRIYRIGRVGLDTGSSDTGGAYTATLKTDKFSPAGEDGLALFRRVALRSLHTGQYTVTMKVFVDGVQTQVYSGGVLVNQTVVFVRAAPTISPAESVEEADIVGQGTHIEVELSVLSTDVTGSFLPETLEVHFHPLRPAKSRAAETA